MEELIRNSIHEKGKSHDCLIVQTGNHIKGYKKAKFTYEAYNAVERCTTSIFDGFKWCPILDIMDLGVRPESSAYNIWDEKKRKERADDLFKKAKKMCGLLLNNQ